jgi:hypothetical protein
MFMKPVSTALKLDNKPGAAMPGGAVWALAIKAVDNNREKQIDFKDFIRTVSVEFVADVLFLKMA